MGDVEVIVGQLEHQLAGLRSPGPDCVYTIHLTGPAGGDFHIIVAGGYGEIRQGLPPGGSNCTITMSAADAVELFGGRLNPVSSFMTGRIKISGDFGAAVRMGQLLRPH